MGTLKFLLIFCVLTGLLIESSLALEYRLTKDVIPDFYDIHLKPYLRSADGDKQFTFDGEVNITLHASVNEVKEITLHKNLLDILEVILYDVNGNVVQKINNNNLKYEEETNKLTISLLKSLVMNTNYTLYFKYNGQIRNGMEGFYRATYDNVNWYGITQLHRIDARTVFPCFDEPEFKAKFRMHINRPNEYKSYFNTRLIETTNDGSQRSIDHFEDSPVMSTYLVAFLISDFESYGNEDLKIIMHSKYNGKTNFAYEVAQKALKAYDNYTQIPYKSLGNAVMQKVGSNYFPHGGMENWGLVIYKDSALAHEPGYTDGWSNKQYTVSLVLHETAHMWFGNSVTHKWWSYFWLNEAFPNFYQYLLGQELYPEYEFDKQFLVKELHSIFEIDATNNSQPMTSGETSINTPVEIGSKFSKIAYSKGAAIVRMFRNLMGKNKFDLAIREYLKENHLKTVTPEDLFKHLKQHWPSGYNIDLDVFFRDWTEQVGYPMVIVSISPTGRFSVKQQRFLLDPQDGSDASLKYTIPITFNHDMMNDFTNLQPKFYLTKNQDERLFANAAHHKWIIVNTQQSNYYRVFYETRILKEIGIVLKQAQHSGIHVNNRASIVDDLLTYGRIGLKDYDEVFEFLEYLATETDYLPWKSAFKGFESFAQRLTLAQRDHFKDYLYEILEKVYRKLGFENPNDTVLDVYNRNNVIQWLCKCHHKDCNEQAQKIFRQHLSANTKPTPDFRETLYCGAVRNDRSDIYEQLREMYLNETFAPEKEKILRALGCTRYFASQQYQFVLSEKVSDDLKITGFKALYAQTPENIIPVFHEMVGNVEDLKKSLKTWSNTAQVISDIANYLTTQEELNLLKEFTKDKGPLFGTSVTTLEDSVKTVEKNLKWAKTYLLKFTNYLTLRNVQYRLSKDVIPDLYDIHLKPYLRQEDGGKQFTFEGEVNITLHATKLDQNKITLHINYMEIKEAILYNDLGDVEDIIHSGNMLHEPITNKLTVYLEKALDINTNYTLYFKYVGVIRDGTEGVFKITYDNVNWYGITQLHRIDARTAFPCFDEPEFKAVFRMHINRPKEYNSVFNTRLINSTIEGDRYIDHFEDTPVMSTYLVAFLISDYESYGNKDLKIIMHSKFKGKTDFAFEVAQKALAAYDNYTQLPYKTLGNTIMQKAGSPSFPHSGMENWGLVLYKDSVLAHEPGYTDGWLDKQFTVSLVVHETAHMWFGNSLTHKWWSYFWLNEGFARYYQYVIGHELYPQYELNKQFLITQVHMIFDIDATNSTQPLTTPEALVNSPDEIAQKFNNIAYAKGAAILRMFANLMGKNNFDMAIREYLKENHLGSTVPKDLFKYLKKYWPSGHNVNLDEFFRDWTEQPGYPMVKVSSINGRYSIKQQRFLMDPNDGSDPNIRYTVPITFTHDRMSSFDNLTPHFYLSKSQEEKVFGNTNPHKWTMVNMQQSNFYRVFYDDILLGRLRKAFKENNYSRIHINNRASMVDDLLAFARVGLRGYDEVFDFLEYLATETEYLPWQAAFKGFDILYQRLTVAQHDKFSEYLFEIIEKVYQKLGFENPNDTVLDVYNRNKVIQWLCRYNHKECNEQAQKRFREHLLANNMPSTDFRETLYCAAVRNDNSNIYDTLKQMFLKQALLSEKEKILRAIGCTRYFVKQHYNFLLSNSVAQDLKLIGLKSLYSQTPENILTVFDLIINDIEKLAESLQDWTTTASVICEIAPYLTTQEQLIQLKQFSKDKGDLFGSDVSLLQSAIKTIEKNFQWSNAHLGKLVNYLSQRNIKYRLPKEIIPDFYDIHIKPYLKQKDGSKQFTFDGEVNITLHAIERDIRKISLHKDYIDIVECRLYDVNGNVVENITSGSLFYETLTDKLTVYFQLPLEINKSYTLYFRYKGQIRDGLTGVFRATYDNVNWYGITQFQRIDARTALPCFDEPEFKAKFRMHISRSNDYKSFFNTRLVETTSDGTDRSIDHFETSPLMSTYLLAFIISDFEAQGNEDFKLIMHSKFANKTNFTHDVALKTLQAYDNYTQLPYKTLGNTLMQKAGSPRFPHNGMENWGLMIYRDSVLYHEPGYTDGWSDKEYTITILAHETSHMWFGNSVTFKWWSYFWLNEAFARYYQYFLAHELYPEYELDKQFVVRQVQLIFDTDATNSTQPLSNPEETINTPSDLGYKFSGITYAKGAAIVRMFANLMGKENFDQAIREYLKENHLKNTVPEDLFKHLKKHWPETHAVDLDEFFKDWTKQVGYPVVTVSASPNGRFSLRQKRFLLDPNDGSDASLRYTIPITFNNDMRTNYSNFFPRFYFNKTQEEMQFGNTAHHDWVVLNTQYSNFYRVLYESELQKQLGIALQQADHSGIHVSNRAGIVDDLFTFAKIGVRGYDEVLEFMEYLATETEYTPWYAAFNGFDKFYPRMTLAQHDKFAPYLFDIIDKVYQKLDFQNPQDTVLDVYNRNKVIQWLCKYHHDDCNTKAQDIFRNHLLSNTKPSPDFRETLYCAAVRNDQFDIYGNLKKMFLDQELSSEKEKILRAMGCSINNVEEHYKFLLSGNVSLDLKTTGLRSLYAQTPENIVPVFKLITDNVEQLQEALQSWSITANVIKEISNYLTTQEQLSLLKEFVQEKSVLFGTSASILENCIKCTENNLKWSNTHLVKFTRYLNDRKPVYRLTKEVIPELYDIYIKPYLKAEDGSKQFSFDGEVNITLFATEENIRKITLHKDYMDILEAVLYDTKGNVVEKISEEHILYENITDKLTVYLTRPLNEFIKYNLYLKYKGQMRDDKAGLFKATYDNVNWYALTQFEQIDARTAFPCFDEPEFKAKFRMRINRPKDYNSYFNTRVIEIVNDGNDRYIDHFEETPVMSTYIVAFIISDFDTFGYKDFKIIMHTKFNGKTSYAYEVGLKSLEAFDSYTQLPYKSMGNFIMQKAGISPFPYGGMENWGLVIYNDAVLANEPGYTDGWSNKQYTLTTVCHETSHMWFGDSTTLKWWSYFWLNEAFARYYGYFIAHEIYPEYELDKQFVVKQIQDIFDADSKNTTQPLTSPEESINTPSEIGYKFNSISYAKGASLLRMFSHLMGKEDFDQAIRDYLKENHLRNTVPEDLFKHLKNHWPKTHMVDLDQFFKDWTEQVGFPVVTVSTSSNGRFSLKQKRFLLDPNDGSDASLRYTIPITFNNDMKTNYSNFSPRFYFNKTLEEVQFGNIKHHDWVVVNTQQTGFYRVLYESNLQTQLRIALEQSNHSGIHVNNRAAVVDDLFAFGRAGLKDYDEIFQFMEYLATETEYSPWYAAFKGFDTLYARMTLEQHESFGKFLYEILDKVYQKLGFIQAHDTILDVYNRNNVINWLCKYHQEDCNTHAQHIFHSHVKAKTKPTPDFRETLYCAACRNDHTEVYGHLKEMFQQEEFTGEKEKIIKAMGCTRHNVKGHYEYILSNKVLQRFKTTAIKALYSQTPENIMTVFQLMTDNVEELAEALESWSTTASVITDISNYLTTQEQVSMLEHFTQNKGHLFGTSVETLEKAVKKSHDNLKWASSHLDKLFNYLNQRNSAANLSAALFIVPFSWFILQILM
ncbi:uncharacterized protein ACRADG_000990 [Cochliomyia hominivorax]